jgi:DNA-binding transcriptional MerR regulator
MEARMLSLFDDEDFLPQEKPKPVKPKKSLDKKENEKQEAEPEDAATTSEHLPVTENPAPGSEAQLPIAEQEETEKQPVPESTNSPVDEPALPETVIPRQEEITEVQPEITTTPLAEEVVPEQETQQEQVTATPPVEETSQEQQEAPVDLISAETIVPENIQEQKTPDVAAETAPAVPVPSAAKQPEDDELNRQILSEIMLSDYSAFIHKDYPFDLKTVEVVKKDKEIKVPEPAKVLAVPATEEEEPEEEENAEPVAPLPEWNLDKRYYTIGEVSQLFKVNTSHIRFWTNEFKLRPRTTRKGDRLYSPEDIAQLRLIHHLVKEKKHTIKGAKEKLKAEKGAVGNKLDLKDALVSLKEMLIQIKEQL